MRERGVLRWGLKGEEPKWIQREKREWGIYRKDKWRITLTSFGGGLELGENFSSTSGRWKNLGGISARLQEEGNLGLVLAEREGVYL